MSRLPAYSAGQTPSEVTDSKAHPPGYIEASGSSSNHASGEVYTEKFNHLATTNGHQSQSQSRSSSFAAASHMTLHATQTDNFVLLADDGRPVYYIDNTSSLSKTIIRSGNSTSSPVVSQSQPPGPFVKEMITDFESKARSKVASINIMASGRFTIVWGFAIKNSKYEWKCHKGVWTLRKDHNAVATYDIGKSFDIDESILDLADVIVSTVFAIDLFARLTAERRVRALKSVSGKNSTPMLGSGLLL